MYNYTVPSVRCVQLYHGLSILCTTTPCSQYFVQLYHVDDSLCVTIPCVIIFFSHDMGERLECNKIYSNYLPTYIQRMWLVWQTFALMVSYFFKNACFFLKKVRSFTKMNENKNVRLNKNLGWMSDWISKWKKNLWSINQNFISVLLLLEWGFLMQFKSDDNKWYIYSTLRYYSTLLEQTNHRASLIRTKLVSKLKKLIYNNDCTSLRLSLIHI